MSHKIAQKTIQLSNVANNNETFYRQIRRNITKFDDAVNYHNAYINNRHHRRHISFHRRRAYHFSPRHSSPLSPVSQPNTARTIDEIPKPVNYEDDIASPIRHNHQLQRPLVVRNATAFLSSPRLQLWKDTSYLARTVGEETVCEIEIGGSFDQIGNGDDTAVTSSTIQFGDYVSYLDMAIDAYNSNVDDGGDITPLEPKDIVYLAQNEIFGGLKEDFTPPKFCTDASVGRGDLYATKIWIGPAGTVSSLHYDPLDNVLLQVVGEKVVTLYPPVPPSSLSLEEEEEDGDIDYYYAGKGHSKQKNVSAVDIERPDLEKFPNFQSAMSLGSKIVIREGDMVFIPKRWWHHIRGDSVWSLSLNCWWN